MTAKQWLAIPEQDLLSELQKSLPGLQKIDWNTAMEWRDRRIKRCGKRFVDAMWQVLMVNYKCNSTDWLIEKAQPKHYLIAAAMAAEGAKE